ncbi:serine/threonine-protein phosphatase 4 regulatory subunit 2 isoform X2 [Coccinella septempunctata]|uniref:serine/threonine-protein phosphatase 4 regulatory subunit 2 isoform X2 n=1 Tax=Coccinella septempunctata TaxID=41139 RepID=UPI001D077756|nr:serine/threonine-protein phosphatase 4 regulatory subunit 2 isoform X2 [Coccinella septempunctata]
MENPEEVLHSLEQFSKFRPKDIPRELEEYLCFVAKTGDPVYQWSTIKHLLREKLINVVTEFYESCSLLDIQPCKNVEKFDYDIMKSFILERLDTFVSAPFTVQRICELLTTPRKEYNRIDKFMRALEKNVLVVSTVEPGMKNAENGDSIVNEMEETTWHKTDEAEPMQFQSEEDSSAAEVQDSIMSEAEDSVKETVPETACSSSQDADPTTEDQKIIESERVEPMNTFIEECSESIASKDVVEDPLPATEIENELNSEPVDSSDISNEVADTEVVSSVDSKNSDAPSEESKISEDTQEDHLKQADSTTSLKSPQMDEVPTDCQLESNSVEAQQICDIQEVQNTIASSENYNANTDSDSNQSSVSTEPDTVNEAQLSENSSSEAKEIISNESEESIIYHEGLNSAQADTTRGYEKSVNTFQNKIEENKDEEITSSDKVVVAIPNTSVDDISDDEAEAEVQKIDIPEETQQGDIPLVTETPENDSQVTASSDEVTKDLESISSELDRKDKGDFNEAEATPESI